MQILVIFFGANAGPFQILSYKMQVPMKVKLEKGPALALICVFNQVKNLNYSLNVLL